MSRPRSDGLGAAFDARAAIAPRERHRGKPLNGPEALWSRLDRSQPEVRPGLGACWLWMGRCAKSGHGVISWGGPEQQTHRVAWSLENGPIPAGAVVRHTCDVATCCNPTHLVLGTIADNNADARERGQARTDQLRAHAEASRGAGNVNAKLSDELVLALRLAHANGETVKQIAERTGLAMGTVHPMLKGRTWKHVPMAPESAEKVRLALAALHGDVTGRVLAGGAS